MLDESAWVALNIKLKLHRSSSMSSVSNVNDLVTVLNENMLMSRPVFTYSCRVIVSGHSAYRWVKVPCFVTGPFPMK